MLIGQFIPFELAAGDNGRVWINAAQDSEILTVWSLIQQTYGMTEESASKCVEAAIQGTRRMTFVE